MRKLFLSSLFVGVQWCCANQLDLTCIQRMHGLAEVKIYGPHSQEPTAFSGLFNSKTPELSNLTFEKIHADYKKQGGKKSLTDILDKAEEWSHQQAQKDSRVSAHLREAKLSAQQGFIQRYASLKSMGIVFTSGMALGTFILCYIACEQAECTLSELWEKLDSNEL